MNRMTHLTVMTLMALVSLFLTIAPASAGHKFEKLSKNHLQYGVSQFLAGNIPNSFRQNLKLMNPNHVTQVAAVLIYQRVKENPGFGQVGDAEHFFGCAVRELTPHAALGISTDVVGDPVNFMALYVEVISAPSTPVKRGTGNSARDEDEYEYDRRNRHKQRKLRVADGLGIIAEASGNEKPLRLIHPGLFSLPSDDVVDGQRQAAIDCVCGDLPEDSDPDTFEDFGISCPEKV